MEWRRIIFWGQKSLWHHIVFIQVFCAVPLTAFALVDAYQNGDLTWSWGFWIGSVRIFLCAVIALVGWYVILPPILRRRADYEARSKKRRN